jgi:DNA gyrase subunit A
VGTPVSGPAPDEEGGEPSAAEEPAEGETGDEGDAGSSGMRYRTQRRGGKGIRDIKTTARNGAVVSIVSVRDDDQVLMMTARGKIQRVNVRELRPMGRNTQGVRIMRTDDGDTLAAVVPVPPSEQEEADAPPETGDVT